MMNINDQLNDLRSRSESFKSDLKFTRERPKLPILEYIYNQIQNVNQMPFLVLCKSILILTDDLFVDLIKITWNLLLNSDQEIASASGSILFSKI
jgi:hypothetical protein